MGLEIAEFILAVEEKFNVNLFERTERDALNVDTLEQFIVLIEEEVAKSPHTQSEADRLFQEKFLAIQKFFAKELGVDTSLLTIQTETASLLRPLFRRRQIWKKMRKEISENIPPLYGKHYREWMGGISVLCAFVFGLGVGIEWEIIAGIFYGFLLFIILFLTLIWFWHLSFSPLFSTIPKSCCSLKDITRHAIRKISLDPDGKIWIRETITETVRRIISEQMNIPVERISLTDRMNKIFG
jgi:hypothetical protein